MAHWCRPEQRAARLPSATLRTVLPSSDSFRSSRRSFSFSLLFFLLQYDVMIDYLHCMSQQYRRALQVSDSQASYVDYPFDRFFSQFLSFLMRLSHHKSNGFLQYYEVLQYDTCIKYYRVHVGTSESFLPSRISRQSPRQTDDSQVQYEYVVGKVAAGQRQETRVSHTTQRRHDGRPASGAIIARRSLLEQDDTEEEGERRHARRVPPIHSCDLRNIHT